MRALARWMVRAAAVAGAVLALAVAAPEAAGQDEADAGVVIVGTRVERPPEGSLRRGVLGVPEWAIWTTAGVVIAGAALALALRIGLGKR